MPTRKEMDQVRTTKGPTGAKLLIEGVKSPVLRFREGFVYKLCFKFVQDIYCVCPQKFAKSGLIMLVSPQAAQLRIHLLYWEKTVDFNRL